MKTNYTVKTINSDGSASEETEFQADGDTQAIEFAEQYQRDYDADGRYYLSDSTGNEIATGVARK